MQWMKCEMSEAPVGYYKVENLTLSQKVYKKLGFGRAGSPRFEREDLDEGQAQGFAPGWFCLDVTVMFDWKDRLRLLVSGKLNIATDCKTDRIIGRSFALTKVAVLPPDTPIQRG